MADSPHIYHPREAFRRSVDRADAAVNLNAEQTAAALHGDGPLLIIAGAGTGKTRTLVHRVAHLIDRGVRPDRILLLTFTRRAAHEMLGRAERLAGATSARVHGGTFHATGHRLLRQFGAAAGLPRDFTVLDEGDAEDLLRLARASLNVAPKERRFPKKETLRYVYSRHINTDRSVRDILDEELPRFAEFTDDVIRIYADYTERKAARNLVDYDDLLLFWLMMLEGSPALAEQIAGMYDHVLVDEYQDTNLLQARILRAMCRTHDNITVVGDDAQSIYSFRGASFRNILDFPHQFPKAAIRTLEQNYRSTQPILDATNTLISRARERYTKNLWTARTSGARPWLVTARDEQQQTRFVADRILELNEEGTPLREMAVLFRAAYMSADLEVELTNRQIPFEKWGGLKFLEAAHVKDVLAFLRVLENPRDEVSWYRLLLLLPGIGDATARSLIASMAEGAWDIAAFSRFTPPVRAEEAHRAVAAMLQELWTTSRASHSVSDDIAAIRTIYDGILADRYDRAEPRLADLDQLTTIASGYATREAFLSALALEPPQSTRDVVATRAPNNDDDDALILSTAHSAKGREWDVVFLIWAADGWFPSSRSLADEDDLEEERRLMYVAMTRARKHLAVVCPLNAYASRWGADYSIDQLSRFIDRGVQEHMQRVAIAGDAPERPAAQPPPESAGIDLRGMMRGRFGGESRPGA